MQYAHALRAPGLSAFALLAITTVSATCAEAAAPSISGTPSSSATVGQAYKFTPSASDADHNTLTFSIANRPGWASFNSTTGVLAGAPFSNHIGTYGGIVISVSDGTTKVSLPSFSIVVKANPNGSPVLSGAPSTTATVGSAYSFQPTGKDPEGKALTWSIMNKPSWASFSNSTGRLSGTPTAAGDFKLVYISASDGVSSTALPTFTISVSGSGSSGGTGSASLSWTPPIRNTDGSTLTNLAGYHVLYGTSSGSLSKTITVANPGLSSYVVDDLASGTWYFAIKAYTASGAESPLSSVGSKTIP